MAKGKHTPGPWKIMPGTSWGIEVAESRYITVEGRSREEAEANVHLIAAAPELLEALEWWLDAHKLGSRVSDLTAELTGKIVARAKGEA